MRLFTASYVAELEDRYGGKSSVDRPPLYYIATQLQYASTRNEIEDCLSGYVSALPSDDQKKIISFLKRPNQTVHTYHELVVGQFLTDKLGYSVRYEYKCPETPAGPDWVAMKDGLPVFGVEVFTKRLNAAVQQQDEQWLYLCDYLRKEIKIGCGLYISAHGRRPPRRAEVSAIAEEVRAWLMTEPPAGEERSFLGTPFKLIGELGTTTHLIVSWTPSAIRIHPKPLHNKIAQKIAQHSDSRIPFVVGVFPLPGSGLDFEDLEDALWGSRTVQLYEHSGEVVAIQNIRLEDGLTDRQNDILDAVLWITGGPNAWRYQVIYTSLALSSTTFDLHL